MEDKHQNAKRDTLEKTTETISDAMIQTIDFVSTRSDRKAFKHFGTLHTITHGER